MSFREWMERNNVSIKSSKKYSAAIYGAIPRMGLGHVPEGEGIEAFEDFLLRVRADESFRFAVRKRVEHRLSVKAHLFFYSGRGNYLSSCGSEITALDRTILPLFLFRSSSTASSHIGSCLWFPSYFAAGYGAAPLSLIKTYGENHEKPD